ncbi:hypothetical protein C8J57DRAFT_1467809 [Mycena rebaudengoi]|nr:hypothetical protein C8J57DRAFT_1467809 [Mycena rebaudengoi]
MSPSVAAHYDEELQYLGRLLRALPEAIPLGDCHDFIGYIPDPKKIAVAGCTQTVSCGTITLPFFRDLLTDKPVDGANKVMSLSNWSGTAINSGGNGTQSGGKISWDGEAEKMGPNFFGTATSSLSAHGVFLSFPAASFLSARNLAIPIYRLTP